MSCGSECKCKKSEQEIKPDVYKLLDKLEASAVWWLKFDVVATAFIVSLSTFLIFFAVGSTIGAYFAQ